MIRFTETALGHIADLQAFYEQRGRDAAVLRMAESLALAMERIDLGQGPFQPAPRPYPELVRYGWRWIKSRGYWIAFQSQGNDWVVTAVFYETANLPGRL